MTLNPVSFQKFNHISGNVRQRMQVKEKKFILNADDRGPKSIFQVTKGQATQTGDKKEKKSKVI